MNNKPVVNYEKRNLTYTEDISWPEGTPDQIISHMLEIKEKFKHWNGVRISYRWTGYEDCDYFVTGWVLESDEDYFERIKYEEEQLLEWEEEQAEARQSEQLKREREIKELEEKLKKLKGENK